MTSKRRQKSHFYMFFFPSFKSLFCHSHFFLVVGWERGLEVVVVACSRKRKVQLSMRTGMRAVVPFCVSIPSLVDNLSNTWMNGMLMQMLDPAALTVLGNEIQAYYELLCLLLTIPK